MRYYLDTNILFFMLANADELSCDVKNIVFNYSDLLYTSTVCVKELIHLTQTGDVISKKKELSVLDMLETYGIKIVPVSEKHLRQMEQLEPAQGHNDPNDHLIVAQAISDKIPLISSDRKFKLYEHCGLLFVFNKR